VKGISFYETPFFAAFDNYGSLPNSTVQTHHDGRNVLSAKDDVFNLTMF